ncbi:DNA translocase FtsK [Oceanobacillus piezotolerans]|uniref:DNA translocase FtsK n=1 Tax=Oceanobacillus piezotolerans TaxID=2448030 RepID=A0A498DH27_9BACI|nr:DNA translocase FtsK [Oceanobacillus piezotolerans]RLL47799.1 DNA translocase FtsK [Oceanobacillus piezotolerans]
MWENWKNKVKNLFADEEHQEQVPTPIEIKKSEIKAKVSYQYPKERPFRFPVIPDPPKDNKFQNQDNNESYNRRSKTNRNQRTNQNRERYMDNNVMWKRGEEAPRPTSRKESSDEPVRKIIKKSDTPFKVSDVPSPIYGFQSRDKAYAIEKGLTSRREDQLDLDNQHLDFQDDEQNQAEEEIASSAEISLEIEESRHAAASELDGKEETTQSSSEDKTEEWTDSHVSRKFTVIGNQSIELDTNYEEEISEESSMDGSGEKENNPPKALEENDNKPRRSYSNPFNVIMTPSDKRNLRDRQRKASRLNADTSQSKQSEYPRKDITTTPEQPKETYLPSHLLNDPIPKNENNRAWIEQQQELLEQTLKHFNVNAKVVKATQGPSVTRFEVHPEMGVKVSKIKNLSDDLKLNMAAKDIRIEAPIPGKNTVGIEIPNRHARMVGLQEVFETKEFKESSSPLTIALGLSIEGEPKITNIQKMPHGLIAGATGSGKSVCINTMLVSLLYKASYEDVKILLIDPKMVELAPYNGIPHLVAPVITDVKAATQSLKWAVTEMEDRYEKFVHEGVRNIEGYNKKVLQQGRREDKMPFIVIVIDELADLMMTSPQDVEFSISRIAQKARACGIHLILATQRPSVDVITGLIKANIPTRIAFSVSSQVDSRTIIDLSGAERLLGKGDMLFVENGAGKSIRLQGPFVSDEEIERVTSYARSLAEPNYLFEQEELLEQIQVDEEEDELLQDAIQFVLSQNTASTSLLQRHYKIGYNRAARLIDTLENRGIISGQNGSKPRDVLVSQLQE